jgi:serralysin
VPNRTLSRRQAAVWLLAVLSAPAQALPVLSVADAIMAESCAQPMQFQVTAEDPVPAPGVTFQYFTLAGSADSFDFQEVPAGPPEPGNTATIPEGETEAFVPIDIFCDDLVEGDETFELHILANPLVYQLGVPIAKGTIVSVDDVKLSVEDGEHPEGNLGTSTATLRLSLTFPAPIDLPMRLTASDGDAVAPDDFTAVDEVVLLRQGGTTLEVPLLVHGDWLIEPDESVSIQISGISLSPESDLEGKLIILDDDIEQRLSVSDAEASEGAGEIVFMVSLEGAVPDGYGIVAVDYQTAAGSALEGEDFLGVSGQLEFSEGAASSLPVVVQLVDDAFAEPDETFQLILSNPIGVNLSIVSAVGVGVVVDDDAYPRLFLSDAQQSEALGEIEGMVFQLRLEPPPVPGAPPVVVKYATVDGTASSSQPDYLGIDGTLLLDEFTPGPIDLVVPIVDDLLPEPSEWFELRIVEAIGAEIQDGVGIGTIIDDDAYPRLFLSDASQSEALGEIEGMVFQLRLEPPPVPGAPPVVVKYATVDGTASSSQPDYQGIEGTLLLDEFTPGPIDLVVPIVDDLLPEPSEWFELRIVEAIGAEIHDGVGIGTIIDDDVPLEPLFVIHSANPGGLVYEGAGAPALALFEVSLLLPPGHAGSEVYTVTAQTRADTSATPDEDFVPVSRQLVLSADVPSILLEVEVLDDAEHEADELLVVELTDPSAGAGVGAAASASVTIRDDETLATPVVVLSALATAVSESAESADFILSLLGAAHDTAVQVAVHTLDDPSPSAAQPGSDFVAVQSVVALDATTPSAIVRVFLIDDAIAEPDEWLTLQAGLLPGSGAILAQPSAQVLIEDDDASSGGPWPDAIFSNRFEAVE